MPEKTKTRCDSSSGVDSEAPEMPKSKKKPVKVRTKKECRTDKWANDTPLVISYCQCVNISIHNLAEGHNHNDHINFLRQLMRHAKLSVNIKCLDDRIKELEGLSSPHNVNRLVLLKEWKGKQMGHTGVLPQYVVKAFVEPAMQHKITGCHADHWHSDLMVGLYCVHQYGAISKENVKESEDSAKPTARGYCPMCSYATGNHASINNHVRVHYRLLLECGYKKCVFVEADSLKMYKHGIEKHKHQKAADNA